MTRIAIHHRPGSFSDRWIEFCKEKGIAFSMVNCYASDIMAQLRGHDVLLWNQDALIASDVLSARRVLMSAEAAGMRVFPNSATCWHYDDKVAQKYLLEGIGAPLVPVHVFYDLRSALDWVDRASFPKVFKLARGAGSLNVFLVRDAARARRMCHQAFGKGFKPIAGLLGDVKTRAAKHRRSGDLIRMMKRLPKTMLSVLRYNYSVARERGYIYFQDFIPDNDTDTRVTIIGDRAFCFIRRVRPNDFRASGSGMVEHDMARIDPRCVRIAFDVAKRLKTQSLAFDFVKTPSGEPKIIEISYCYVASFVHQCPGQWDSSMNWHEGNVWPQDAILLDLMAELKGQ